MAHWSERVETEAKRTFGLVSRLAKSSYEAGNRRRVVVRDKSGKTVFKVSLSYVVIGALALFFFARRLFLFALLGLFIAYALGYRAEVVRLYGSP